VDLGALFSKPQILLPMVVLFYAVLFLLKTTTFKGKLGDNLIKVTTRTYLDNHLYHVLNKVTLPAAEGTARINHLIVSIYGVFVIETLNMKGLISGSVDEQTWLQKRNLRSQAFQNPLLQNDHQVKALQKLLQLSSQQVFLLLVFIDDSRFKSPMPDNVTQGKGFIQFIQKKKTPLLTEAQVNQCLETIEKERLFESIYAREIHLANTPPRERKHEQIL
jgi:restriction system protein